MEAGISTACYYPLQTESALKKIVDAGVQATEIFFNASSELEDSFLRILREIIKDSGTKIQSLHPFISNLEGLFFFSDYERRFWDSIEQYKRQYFHAANMLGASIVVFHGGNNFINCPMDLYCERYSRLAEVARSMGVTLAHENVVRCVGRLPDFFKSMRSFLPDASFVLDVKQCIRAGVSPLEMADAMGSGIVHLHISDHSQEHDCIPLGQGALNIKELLAHLAQLGFDGTVLLELYRNSYTHTDELYESYRIIRQATAQYS